MTRTIYGQVPSKSNGYRTAGSRFYVRPDIRKYNQDFARQWVRADMITTEFELTLKVWFRTDRSDLDGAFKAVLDNLQSVGAIKNDSLCVRIVAEKFVDKSSPRVELSIKKHNNE